MFLGVRFILLISDFIVENLNILANDAVKASKKISQFNLP